MRRAALIVVAATLCGCGGDPAGSAAVAPSSPAVRAARRLFDGAPPVIPHPPIGAPCLSCHAGQALAVPALGVAPPSPHGQTPGMSAARCEQCHAWKTTAARFRPTGFRGLPQDLRPSARLYPGAPPVMPHRAFMREDCLACHDGPAARAPIVTPHPDRLRCRQCHVEPAGAPPFSRAAR